MASEVTNYKCPACTGPLHFVGQSGKLECDYCGNSFDLKTIEDFMEEENAQAAAESEQNAAPETEWDTSHIEENWIPEGMRAYSCPSCGAELICEETTAATSCPYCGNNTIVPGQLTGVLKPDYVIPFKLSREDAMAALRNHYKGKLFLPKAFTEQNHVEELRGIYVPFWLYDGVAEGEMKFNATRTRTHRSGNYEVTTTDHYIVFRSGSLPFEKIPVDGSSKMPDDHMDAVEPFDYKELAPFSNAYLPGFLAERYDEDAEKCAPRADTRAENTLAAALTGTVVGYSSVVPMHKNIRLNRGRVSYALMPVYLLNTRWKDKGYLFAMNGQTGKMVGNLPADMGKMWGSFFALFAGVGTLVYFLLNMMMG